MCHSHISREDQGCYALRVYLRVWLKKKKKGKNVGGEGIRRGYAQGSSGPRTIIMATLSKRALVCSHTRAVSTQTKLGLISKEGEGSGS